MYESLHCLCTPLRGAPLSLGTAGLRKLGIFSRQLYLNWWWRVEAWLCGPEKPLQPARARLFPPPYSPAAGCVLVLGWRWTLLCWKACRGKKHHVSVWNRLNEHRAAVLLSLAHSDKIYFIVHRETQSLRQRKDTEHNYKCLRIRLIG